MGKATKVSPTVDGSEIRLTTNDAWNIFESWGDKIIQGKVSTILAVLQIFQNAWRCHMGSFPFFLTDLPLCQCDSCSSTFTLENGFAGVTSWARKAFPSSIRFYKTLQQVGSGRYREEDCCADRGRQRVWWRLLFFQKRTMFVIQWFFQDINLASTSKWTWFLGMDTPWTMCSFRFGNTYRYTTEKDVHMVLKHDHGIPRGLSLGHRHCNGY